MACVNRWEFDSWMEPVHQILRDAQLRRSALKDLDLNNRLLRIRSGWDCNEQKAVYERLMRLGNCRDELVDCGRLDDYEWLGFISSGGYGKLHKARNKATGEIVAVKEEVKGMDLTTVREIGNLKLLPRHPNVVGFKEVATDDVSNGVFVGMEYVEHDLSRYMEAEAEAEAGRFTTAVVKSLMLQLLKGVSFIHAYSIMHRDLKPANLLVKGEGVLMICDFGLSRKVEAVAPIYATWVGTGFYRAPELLIGKKDYSEAVDMWAVGCVMAEMLLRSSGDTKARERLGEIYKTIWEAEGGSEGFSCLRCNVFPAEVVTDAGFNLLSQLLSWEASGRITAESALSHCLVRRVVIS